VKVATWNVNGIRAREAQLLEWLDREAPDVVCLQEIKAAPEQLPQSLCTLAGYHCAWHGRKGYSGVALMLSKTKYEPPVFEHPVFDIENRIVTATHGTIVFGSVYIPNGGKDFVAKMQFLRDIDKWTAELQTAGKHLVLCGDFNVALTDRDVHPMERRPVVGQLREERALIESMLSHGLIDVGRACDPDNDRLFTWWAPWRNLRQRNIGWRLDYIAASKALVDETVHCVAYRDVGTSDHGPVIAHLRDTPC
jgi:exodeoxyribonuclease III